MAVAQSTLNDKKLENKTYNILSNGNLCIEYKDKECINELEVKVSGEVPKGGSITIENGKIKDVELVLSEKTIVKNNEGMLVFKSEESNIIFEDDVTLSYLYEGFYSLDKCFDESKFKNNSRYKITIRDINNIEKIYEVTSSFGKVFDLLSEEASLGFTLGNKKEIGYSYSKNHNSCFLSMFVEESNLEGNYNIELEYVSDEAYSHVLKVEDNSIEIFSTELVEGDAIIEVKDSDGVVTNFNVIVESDSAYRYIYIDSYDYRDNNNIYQMFDKYYQILQDGKNITVTIKQGDNNYVLGGTKFEANEVYDCSSEEYYYWGNNKLGYLFGC